MKEVVTGVVSLRGHLPITNNWPHFDAGKFRVITLVTSCAAPGGAVIVAWADLREGRSRIYFRRSNDKGLTWEGPVAGRPLLPNVNYGNFECFHPQIVCTNGTGVVGCSFYVFGKWQGDWYRINVQPGELDVPARAGDQTNKGAKRGRPDERAVIRAEGGTVPARALQPRKPSQ